MADMYRKFLVNPQHGLYGARLWVKHNSDDYVLAALKLLSKWQGHDKEQGQLVSYEFDVRNFEVACRLLLAFGFSLYDNEGDGNPWER